MRKHIKLSTASVALALAVGTSSAHGASPALSMSRENPTEVRLEWNSDPGKSYQVLATHDIDPFSLWLPAGSPVTATASSTAVITSSVNDRDFFKLHVLGQPASGLPTVQIVSHTGGETVYGLIKIIVAAQDDSRLSSVSLLIDGKEQDIILTEGSLEWIINTGHFPNGPAYNCGASPG